MSGVFNMTSAWNQVYDPNLIVDAKQKGVNLANSELGTAEALVQGYNQGQTLQANQIEIEKGKQQLEIQEFEIQKMPEQYELDKKEKQILLDQKESDFQIKKVKVLSEAMEAQFTAQKQREEADYIQSIYDAPSSADAVRIARSTPSAVRSDESYLATQIAMEKVLQDPEALPADKDFAKVILYNKREGAKTGQLPKEGDITAPGAASAQVSEEEAILQNTKPADIAEAQKELPAPQSGELPQPAAPAAPKPAPIGQNADGTPIYPEEAKPPVSTGKPGADQDIVTQNKAALDTITPETNPDFFNYDTNRAIEFQKISEMNAGDQVAIRQQRRDWAVEQEKLRKENRVKVDKVERALVPAEGSINALKRDLQWLDSLKKNGKAVFGPNMNIDQITTTAGAVLGDEEQKRILSIKNQLKVHALNIAKARSSFTGGELNSIAEQETAALSTLPITGNFNEVLSTLNDRTAEIERARNFVTFSRIYTKKLGHADGIEDTFEKYLDETDPTVVRPNSEFSAVIGADGTIIPDPEGRKSPEEWIGNGQRDNVKSALVTQSKKLEEHAQKRQYEQSVNPTEFNKKQEEKKSYYNLLGDTNPAIYQKKSLRDLDYQLELNDVAVAIPSQYNLRKMSYDKLPKVDRFTKNFTPAEMLRFIKRESGGDPNALGKDGEVGLTQVMPSTARSVSQASYYKGITVSDLDENKKGDSRLISDLPDAEWSKLLKAPRVAVAMSLMYLNGPLAVMFPDKRKRVMAYNWGEGNLQKYYNGQRSMNPAVLDYVNEIMPEEDYV